MLSTTWIILISLGVLIIFGLAVYAGKLLMQVKQQQQAIKSAQEEAHKKHIEHDSKIYDSVIIIVRAMKEAQCEFGEGAWRLSVLLDSLKLEQNQSSKFPAIVELYDSIKHHAILEERKQLPKKQRMKQDAERMTAEAKLTEKISEELNSLHDLALARKSALSE